MDWATAEIDFAKTVLEPQFQDRANWPMAETGKICLFEAVDLLGRSQFGLEWIGTELSATWWSRDEHLRRQQAAPQPGWSIEPTPLDRKRASQLGMSLDKWMERKRAALLDRERDHTIWMANVNRFTRLELVVNRLAALCRDGETTSYFRPVAGGALVPMHRTEWNFEHPLRRCMPKGGLSLLVDGVLTDVYLFFDRLGLQTLPNPGDNSVVGPAFARTSQKAIIECRTWLEQQFSEDPDHQRTKRDFWDAAKQRFGSRLSKRAFDNTVWPQIAPQNGRSKRGAKKRKS